MEPPAAVAEFSDGKVTVWAPTQNPQAVQEAVAAALGHRQEGRHLPRDAARRRLRPQVEAGLRGRSGGAVEEARQAGQGDLDARGRHPLRLLPHDGGRLSQGDGGWPRQADGVAASIGVPADRLDVRAGRARATELRARSRARRSAVRRRRTSAPRTVRPTRTCASAGSAPSATTSTRLPRTASPTRWRRPRGATRSSSCSTCSGPGKVLDLKAQGVDYSNYGAPIEKYPIDTRRLRRVLGDGRREVRLGQAQVGRRLGHGHRRASQLQHLRRLGRRGRGGCARRPCKVPRIDQVVDAGVIVNPDRVRSQMEGAAVMAVGLARTGEITATGGRISRATSTTSRSRA